MNTWKQSLQRAKKEGTYRTLQPMDGRNEHTIYTNEQSFIPFHTNDYLGWSTDPRLIQTSIEATKTYGVGSTGSRLTSGDYTLYHELEKKVARLKSTERALLFNSGYDANLAWPQILPPDAVVLSDALNHASIIDGLRLARTKKYIYPHRDMNRLEQLLQQLPATTPKWIVTDSVFSMDGTIAPLREIVALKKKYPNTFIMIDEAHATGVVGPRGKGVAHLFNVEHSIDLFVGTFSKALGSSGGFIAGSKQLIESLINHARSFIFTTALPPAVVAVNLRAVELLEVENEAREHVHRLMTYFTTQLRNTFIPFVGGETPIFGILCETNERALALEQFLQRAGLFVKAIRPPTVPEQSSRIRITLTARHKKRDVDHLLHNIQLFFNEMGDIQ